LTLHSLEARETPATFGEAWLDGTRVTLSFAPEGTPIIGVGSSLGALFSPLGETNARNEILRAFQAWAARTNLNIGIVADLGTAFEQSGGLQTDHRYGDVRIGARPLASDVVAITAPSSPWSSQSGDIVVNNQKQFSIGGGVGTFDVYSVFLQESGHALGLGRSDDSASVMKQGYAGVRTGLAASDVAAVRALYGTRLTDAFEGTTGNDTQATATLLTGAVEADLTTAADADWYVFTSLTENDTWVRLKAAGVSLVTARVEVYNAAGDLLASGVATDPQDNNVFVQVGGLGAGATYYIKVTADRTDDFGVGAYVLGVDELGGLPSHDPTALVSTETQSNSLTSNTSLTRVKQLVSRPGDYLTRSSLASSWDVDVYKVTAPAAGASPHHLVVSVAGVGTTYFKPIVEVYNSAGTRLSTSVASKSGNHLVVTLSNATPGADYLIRVRSGNDTVANYDVAAVFRTIMPSFHGSNGTLTEGASVTRATMNVYQSQVFHFTLGANEADGGDDNENARVWVTVYNSSNQVVFSMSVKAGEAASKSVFLGRGSYKVEVKMTNSWENLTYGLQMYGLTDPEGAPLPGQPGGSDSDNLPPPPDPNITVTVTGDPDKPPLTTWF
jgi:hypothetical protein